MPAFVNQPSDQQHRTVFGAPRTHEVRGSSLRLAVVGALVMSALAVPALGLAALIVIQDLRVRDELFDGLGVVVGGVVAAMAALVLLAVLPAAVLLHRRRARALTEPTVLRVPARVLAAGAWLVATPVVLLALVVGAALGSGSPVEARQVVTFLVPVLVAALPLVTGLAAARVLTRR